MVDEFERKHGPVVDRSEFDGEFVVPPHLKNLAHMFSAKPMRLQGGLLGSLSRSRTFLTLQVNSRDYLHSSVPDLSRSVPTTPSSNQRMTLANSVESVLEENDSTMLRPPSATANGAIEMRRMSEQDSVQYKRGAMKLSKMAKQPIIYTTTPSHFRNNSEPMNRLFPFNSKTPPPPPSQVSKKSNTCFEGIINRSANNNNLSKQLQQQQQKSAAAAVLLRNSNESSTTYGSSSMHNISTFDTSSISKWGNVRNSNSFSAELNINTLSRYTIPRVSLAGTNNGGSGGAGSPTTGILLTDSRRNSPHNGVEDSAA